MRKKGYEPIEPYKTARSPWKCRCLVCGRISKPSYWNTRNSNSKQKGCAICVGVKIDPNEVKEKMLRAGLKTFGHYPGKDKPWKCRCLSCGTWVYPYWNNIRNGAGGCGKCRYIKSGRSNRLPEKDAIARMLKAQLQPLEPYINKEIPWKCKCLQCENVTYPTLGNITKGQGGCGFCRETGLSYTDPAYLYLLVHEEFHSIKVGVSNFDSRPNRIKAHQTHGWKVIKVYEFKTGKTAELVESKVLRWLRLNKKLPPSVKPKQMPQGGFSETASLSGVGIIEINRKIQSLLKSSS